LNFWTTNKSKQSYSIWNLVCTRTSSLSVASLSDSIIGDCNGLLRVVNQMSRICWNLVTEATYGSPDVLLVILSNILLPPRL